MNKSNVINLLAALMFAACTSTPNSYVIEGVVPDSSYNGQTVYMYDFETSKKTDSTIVVDGNFTFTGSVDTAVIRRLVLERLYTILILENGKISVDMDMPGSAKGTPMNDKMSKYELATVLQQKEYSEKHLEISQKQDVDEETRTKQLEELFQQTIAKYDSLHLKVFNTNKENIIGAYVLLCWVGVLGNEGLDSIYAQASDVVRKFKPLKTIVEENAKFKQAAKQTAVGMPFTDFTIENGGMDGSKVSFSDYVGKGKYVLVDFWASWCGPCIAEVPVLVEVYKKYKGDKFELLGVAVSDKREETLKSIETHKIPWPQIFETGRIPIDLYGIIGIPYIILFGPDGKILARDLRGDDLKAKMKEIMQ